MKNRVENLPQHRFAKQFVLIPAFSALLISIAFLALPSRTPVLAQVNLPWNYTTVADFTACQSIADSTNVTITNNSGGEIRLASIASGNFILEKGSFQHRVTTANSASLRLIPSFWIGWQPSSWIGAGA